MHHPTDRIAHTTAFVTPVVEQWPERKIAQWVHPMKDRSDDPSHNERTLLPWSYILFLTVTGASVQWPFIAGGYLYKFDFNFCNMVADSRV